jgi:hypothetical protein
MTCGWFYPPATKSCITRFIAKTHSPGNLADALVQRIRRTQTNVHWYKSVLSPGFKALSFDNGAAGRLPEMDPLTAFAQEGIWGVIRPNPFISSSLSFCVKRRVKKTTPNYKISGDLPTTFIN